MHYVARWVRFMTHPVIMVIYGLAVVLAYVYVDKPIALKVHALGLDAHYSILVWITQLGRSVLYLTIIPVIGLYLRYGKRVKQEELRIWFLWLTLLGTNAICFGMKIMLGRARPELLFEHDLFGFFGWQLNSLYHSFPSGHVTLLTTMILSLTMLFPRYRWVYMTIALVVMATRVLLSYHYLSDVLATSYLVVLEYRLLLYIVARECPLYWIRLGIV